MTIKRRNPANDGDWIALPIAWACVVLGIGALGVLVVRLGGEMFRLVGWL